MEWLTGLLDTSGGGLTAGSIGGAIAVIVVALRKRRDVDVTEMQKRITDLTDRVDALETVLGSTRDALVKREGEVFVLRSTLARNGIPDPTATLEAS